VRDAVPTGPTQAAVGIPPAYRDVGFSVARSGENSPGDDKRGAHAAPVFNRKGQVEEVHLFREGALQASISRPDAGRIWVWRPGRNPAYAGDIPEAVERGLDPLRKQQHKETKSQEMELVRLMVAAPSEVPATPMAAS
jgi:hypothetical protein